MGWRDQLPRIRAENAEWREQHLPRLQAHDRQREAERDAGRAALARIAPADRLAITTAYGRDL